jgi:hypothetical protein
VIKGGELESWVGVARELGCSLLIDEFYSHYVWSDPKDDSGLVSAARYVDDVNADPVVLFDGLTKNWRYPGWRCTWIVAPQPVIEAVSSSGSFLDGGGSKPLQRSAIPLLAPDLVRSETAAIHQVFRRKRGILSEGLKKCGIRFDVEPEGTFYCWGDISALPAAINDGMSFFRAALERQVICVPGEFFDVNPGKRRSGRPSRFRHYVRFSFGPEEGAVVEGVKRIQEMIAELR